ncbi:tail fiber domain-containing protein [Runella sp.]|uniref:tail fiber domain-containing protein n=1 Tax=Runella sp. TaxID=1960881 RepID=UPI003D0E3A9E
MKIIFRNIFFILAFVSFQKLNAQSVTILPNQQSNSDTLSTKFFRMTSGAGLFKVLISDDNGNGLWAAPSMFQNNFWQQNSSNNLYSLPNALIGIGKAAPSQKLHLRGNLLVERGRILTFDSGKNVFVGEEVGGIDTTYSSATDNTAIGSNAFQYNKTGKYNTAVGRQSLQNNVSGIFNTALGFATLNNNTNGSNNVALGSYSLVNNVSGEDNVALGHFSGFSSIGSGNIFIGAYAGADQKGNNKLYISNNSNSTLIYGDFAKKKLVVNDSLESKYFKLPINAAAGKILASDNLGNAAWQSETDPKIGTQQFNYLAKWDGSKLVAGSIFDSGDLVGIGAGPAGNKLLIKMTNGSSYFPNWTVNNEVLVTQIHRADNANPQTRFLDKTNSATGFFDLGLDANNNFTVESNDINRLTILQDGKTGIGNTTPTQKLDVNGSANINGDLYLKSFKVLSNGGVNNTLTVNGILNLDNNLKTNAKWISSDGDNEGIRIDGEGNVGVNEVNSNVVFTVKGTQSSLFLIKNASDNFQLLVNQKGNVGIGTADLTKAKLTITGSEQNTLNYGYFNNQGKSGTASGTNYYSIYASDRIAAAEFNAFSDARIKDIKGISDNEKDLETLSKIEITDYQFKDKIGKGNGQYKKVIAQQVESIYPQAVSKLTDCIPDIYQLAKISNDFIELPHHNLKAGEKVRLIFGEKQETFEVESVNEAGFKILNQPSEIVHSSVFVYGREVSDFRSVDYEALSMLNISATQALLRRLNEVEKALEQQHERIESQQGQINTILSRLTTAEKNKIMLSN